MSGNDLNSIVERAGRYLDKLPEAIAGAGGHAALFRAAAVASWGFALEEDAAVGLLLARYNPRCQPPWAEDEIRHKVQDAAGAHHEKPRGHLLVGGPVRTSAPNGQAPEDWQ